MRVIVCGGRDYADGAGAQWANLRRAILSIHQGANGPISLLIHGNARGADTAAGCLARDFQIPCDAVPAQWKKFGDKAGPIRNKKMLGMGVDLVIAFPGGRGTANMVKQARAAGVEVREVADGEFYP